MAQLSANFANLQSEYDNAQDVIEALKKEGVEVSKNLKQSVEQYTDTKLKLSQAENQLSQFKANTAELERLCKKASQEVSELKSTLEEKVVKFNCLIRSRFSL